MQGVEGYVLQRRDDVRSIRYDNVGSRLRDVTVGDRLSECVVRKARECDEVTLRTCAMDLEIGDHIMSAHAEGEDELVVAGAANQAVVAGAADDDIVAGATVEGKGHRPS